MNTTPILITDFRTASTANVRVLPAPSESNELTWLSYTDENGVEKEAFRSGRPSEADLARIEQLSKRFGIDINVRIIEIEVTPPATDTVSEKLFSTAQVAEQLGVSYETVLNWTRAGLIVPTLDTPALKAFSQAAIDARKPPRPARRPTKAESAARAAQ